MKTSVVCIKTTKSLAYVENAVNAHDDTVKMLNHLESWLRDDFFAKDEAHCLQKAYEVAQAIATAEARHD